MKAHGSPPWLKPFKTDLVLAAQTSEFPAFLAIANEYASKLPAVTAMGHPLQFVAQTSSASAAEYENQINKTGQVPTRDNRHDRYNALIWLHFPKTKAALNHAQVSEIRRQGASTRRGKIRDALTLWDENLAILTVPSSQENWVREMLSQHAWSELFVGGRSRWDTEWQVTLFGHALLEKLDKPYKSLTAHLIVEGHPRHCLTSLDTLLSRKVGYWVDPKNFLHLPILGVPQWSPDNASLDYYEDRDVFRLLKNATSEHVLPPET